MGEIAEMMIMGLLCEQCGEYIDGDYMGHPRRCASCEPKNNKITKEIRRNDTRRKVNSTSSKRQSKRRNRRDRY